MLLAAQHVCVAVHDLLEVKGEGKRARCILLMERLLCVCSRRPVKCIAVAVSAPMGKDGESYQSLHIMAQVPLTPR